MFTIRETLNKMQIFWKKKHFSTLIKRVAAKSCNTNQTLSYVWRLEQGKKRGRWHYHLMISGYIPKQIMVHFWKHGFVNYEVIDSSEKAKNYLNKYFNKTCVPDLSNDLVFPLDKNHIKSKKLNIMLYDRDGFPITRPKYRTFGRSRDMNLDLLEKNMYETFSFSNASFDSVINMLDTLHITKMRPKKGNKDKFGHPKINKQFHLQTFDPNYYRWGKLYMTIGMRLSKKEKYIDIWLPKQEENLLKIRCNTFCMRINLSSGGSFRYLTFDSKNFVRKFVNYDVHPLWLYLGALELVT